MPHRTRKELLEIVHDKDGACVDRGEVIVKLIDSGMSQAAIAESTQLSTSAISHLKTCFLNLEGKAREMCKGGKMNGDACYSLARAPDLDRERILRRAVELRRIKDTQRSVQGHTGPKGRQTLAGQITDEDMKEAIRDVKVGKASGSSKVK
jgi:hypothetical protein